MPQRFLGNGIGWGPNLLLDRLDLAAQIANTCSNWVLIEQDLAWIYSLLMGLDLPTQSDGNVQIHPIGFLIFEALHTIQQKLDFLRRLLQWRKLEDELVHFNDALCKTIRKRANERNIIAHGQWGVSETLPNDLILVGRDMSYVYRKDDFEQLAARTLELHEQLQTFLVSIHEKLKK